MGHSWILLGDDVTDMVLSAGPQDSVQPGQHGDALLCEEEDAAGSQQADGSGFRLASG